MELKIEYIKAGELKAYANNAKLHPAEQVEQIKNSIEQFGFNDPIAVWKDNEIIEGHGRLLAALEIGGDDYKVPVIKLDELTDEQRRAYMLVHNKLTMNSPFDIVTLQRELESIQTIDMTDFGFMSREEIEKDLNSFFTEEELEPKIEQEKNRIKFTVYADYESANALSDWLTEEGLEYERF